MAEHMITTEKAKPGCDDNDRILLYQHTDYNPYPNAKNHQSQKSSHIPNLVLWSYNILCRKAFWNTASSRNVLALSEHYGIISCKEKELYRICIQQNSFMLLDLCLVFCAVTLAES